MSKDWNSVEEIEPIVRTNFHLRFWQSRTKDLQYTSTRSLPDLRCKSLSTGDDEILETIRS